MPCVAFAGRTWRRLGDAASTRVRGTGGNPGRHRVQRRPRVRNSGHVGAGPRLRWRVPRRLRSRGVATPPRASALMPLVREGDPTRTLIDATRPVHARTRVRVMARNVVAAVGWLADGRDVRAVPGRRVGAGGAGVTAAAPPVAADPRALRGGHRHRGPLPAPDRVEDVLLAARPRTRTPPPNTHVCPVCLGLPGTLPVINRRAVEHVIATGLAIEAAIPERTQWERKNYFYPDLPKGYQISQYAIPLAARGRLDDRDVRRPVHGADHAAPTSRRTRRSSSTTTPPGRDGPARACSLVDFNRSGAPLMEIVTEPTSGPPSRHAATPRSSSCCCARSG